MSPDPNRESEQGTIDVPQQGGSARAAAVFGGTILVALIAACIYIPNPSDFQCRVIRFAMALDAGFLSYFFLGGVTMQGTISGYAIKATGSFVLFVLLQFVVNPLDLQAAAIKVNKNIVPANKEVRQAQMILHNRYDYKGPIDGRLHTVTRTALENFQRNNNLKQTGRVNRSTLDALKH